MYIEELPSGSYRITQTKNGHRYRVTVDHKPEDDEAIILMAKVIQKRPSINNMRFDDAAEAFIDSKSNILSPSTIREYKNSKKKVTEDFSKKYINAITSLDIQKQVNIWSEKLAPKTVKNYANFVIAVLKSSDIDVKSPQLPQKDKKSIYIPTVDDIKAVEANMPEQYKVAYFLACLGLRRSEIIALSISDLDGTTLTINKAMVLNDNKEWVLKKTKTTDSTRTVIIPQDIADKIREKGYIYKGHPANLYDNLRKAQDKAGVPHFKLHAMRHFFCSYMHDKGYSDKQIQEMGGWKTSYVLDTVYKHAMNMNETKKQMSNDISNIFS